MEQKERNERGDGIFGVMRGCRRGEREREAGGEGGRRGGGAS